MTVATQIQAVVVAWQIYELTRDPLSLGLIGLAEAVPFIGFALVPRCGPDQTPPDFSDGTGRLAPVLPDTPRLYRASRHHHGRPSLADLPGHLFQRYSPQFSPAARSALGAELVPRELYPNAGPGAAQPGSSPRWWVLRSVVWYTASGVPGPLTGRCGADGLGGAVARAFASRAEANCAVGRIVPREFGHRRPISFEASLSFSAR